MTTTWGTPILPGLVQPIPQIAVVADTSGSMGETDIARVLAEITGILQNLGNREPVTVLATDAAVHTCRKVFDVRQVKLIGGGGTDMGAGLEAAARLRPQPDIVVVITDGDTPWPEQKPVAGQVIVVLTRQGYSGPSWARTIIVEGQGDG